MEVLLQFGFPDVGQATSPFVVIAAGICFLRPARGMMDLERERGRNALGLAGCLVCGLLRGCGSERALDGGAVEAYHKTTTALDRQIFTTARQLAAHGTASPEEELQDPTPIERHVKELAPPEA